MLQQTVALGRAQLYLKQPDNIYHRLTVVLTNVPKTPDAWGAAQKQASAWHLRSSWRFHIRWPIRSEITMQKHSPSCQAVWPPEVIKGNAVKYWTTHCDLPREATRKPTTLKYSYGPYLTFPLPISPLNVITWLKVIYRVSSHYHYIAHIRFCTSHCGSSRIGLAKLKTLK